MVTSWLDRLYDTIEEQDELLSQCKKLLEKSLNYLDDNSINLTNEIKELLEVLEIKNVST